MTLDPSRPPSLDPDVRVYERLAELERQMREIRAYMQGGALQQVPVVDALPTAGRKGRVVMLATDNLLYRDDGTSWALV